MKVLVTGASGFIGRRVVSQLVAEQRFEVTAASRHPDPGLPPGVHHEAVDLLVPGAPRDLVERTRPTHLVHLAWNAQPGRFWTAPDNLDWSAATVLLTRAFAEAGGRRAVMAGTCAEYDWTGPGRLAEDAPSRPATFYGAVKDATRRATCAAGDVLGLSVAWGRVFWLYGANEASGRLVADVARSLALGRPVETSEGMQRRDFLHVDDVAGAFVAALVSDRAGTFNVGSGTAVPIRRVVEILAAASGRPDLVRFGARPTNPLDPPQIEADTAILTHEIGFVPRVSLEEGLEATFAWWKQHARA